MKKGRKKKKDGKNASLDHFDQYQDILLGDRGAYE